MKLLEDDLEQWAACFVGEYADEDIDHGRPKGGVQAFEFASHPIPSHMADTASSIGEAEGRSSLLDLVQNAFLVSELTDNFVRTPQRGDLVRYLGGSFVLSGDTPGLQTAASILADPDFRVSYNETDGSFTLQRLPETRAGNQPASSDGTR